MPTRPVSPVSSSASNDIDIIADRYFEAGRSPNTERSYQSHVNHYQWTWKGNLPATPEDICRYLATYAGALKVSTLRQRLSALSKWHMTQGFPDPIANIRVKQTIKGIAKAHQTATKQAYPLTFRHMLAICDRLESQKKAAIECQDHGAILRTHRDLALILVGFWQGFRSDELSRVSVENVQGSRSEGLSVYLSHSKADRDAKGRLYELPALKAYCPASAFIDWIEVSGISEGLAFRSINRWGQLSNEGINKQSIAHILNRIADGLFPDEPNFSTHSLRHGFADWAVNAGWDLVTLMDHVGWRSVESARKYMPTRKNFGSLALSNSAAIRGGDLSSLSGQTLPSFVGSLDGMSD